MKNNLISWICITGVIVGLILCIPLSEQAQAVTDPNGLYVNCNDPDAFATLDEAVRAAGEGDTIYVGAGHSEIVQGRRFTQEELSSLMAMAKERDTYPYKSEESNALQKKINAILYKSVEGEICIDKPGLTIIGLGEPKPEIIFTGDSNDQLRRQIRPVLRNGTQTERYLYGCRDSGQVEGLNPYRRS